MLVFIHKITIRKETNMKKHLNNIILAVLICTFLSSCSSAPNNKVSSPTNEPSVQTEQEPTIPKYNTFGITPDDLFKKIGDKSSYSYTKKESVEGMVEFSLNDTIYDVSYGGIIEEATGEIMILQASYPAKGNDGIAILGTALIDSAVDEIMNTDKGSDYIIEAWNSDGHTKTFGNYTIIAGIHDSTGDFMVEIADKDVLKLIS